MAEITVIAVAGGQPGISGSKIYVDSGAPAPTLGANNDVYLDDVSGDLYFKAAGVWAVEGNFFGPQGDQGDVGPAGPQGNPGVTGSQIYTQSGIPSSGTGINGDFSLDTVTGNYYKKAAGVWVLQGSLIGPQGPQGSQLRTGSGVPSNGLGNNTDFYIDNVSQNYYLKAAGVYTLQGQLAGGALRFSNTWNASTNTPTLASGAGAEGEVYIVTSQGVTMLDGISTWNVRDWAVFLNGAWRKVENNTVDDSIGDSITTRAPSQNAVFDALALKQDIASLGADARAAVVIDSIADADVDHAPSRNAVFDALALKQDASTDAAAARAAVVIDSIADADVDHAPSRNAVFDALAAKLSTNPGTVTDTNGAFANKPAVTVVATTNQALTGTPVIDGQATAVGSIILLSAQTAPAENGPWVAAAGVWARPTWFPNGGTTQAFQFITSLVRLGTTYQGTTWRMTTAGPITIGTDAQVWVVTPLALSATSTTGVLPETRGGTNQSTYAQGDLLYASAANTLSKLPAGTIGQFIRMGATVPSWSDFTDPANEIRLFDDWMTDGTGALRWLGTVVGAGANNATGTTVADNNHPGILELVTGTTATGQAARYLGGVATGTATAGFILGGGAISQEWLVRLEDLSTGVERYTFDVGLVGVETLAVDAVRLRYSDNVSANWLADTISASTSTSTDTGIAVVADAWVKLRIEINAAGNSIGFYINGVLVATNTTNIPTVVVAPRCRMLKSVGTTSRQTYVDYFKQTQRFTVAR